MARAEGHPLSEIDITREQEAAHYVERLNGGNQSAPTVLFDGVHLATEPSTEDLEQLLGHVGRFWISAGGDRRKDP